MRAEDVVGSAGRRVGVGRAGSGSALTARTVMRAYGLAESSVWTEALSYSEAAARLVEGPIDAPLVGADAAAIVSGIDRLAARPWLRSDDP